MNKKIKCRNCGKLVNSNAKRCPNCGTLLKMSPFALFVILAFIAVTIILIIIGMIQS